MKLFLQLQSELEGDLFIDEVTRLLYATDASAYREKPLAVARPKGKADLKRCVEFARKNKIPLIPRTAGTSLAGQVVGSGMVVDVSRYMGRILEVNTEERWVRVEPGVILDELNAFLMPMGLFFGPETSTSNRCMIGGMLGNNACGAHSLLYGSTRDHTLEVEAILSDGSEAVFGPLPEEGFKEKCSLDSLEGDIYRILRDILSDPSNQEEIRKEYPHPAIRRRNTGYALDLLLNAHPFTPGGEALNLSRLLAGSEGTLALTTAVKLNLVPLQTLKTGLLCVHFHRLEEAFRANLIALKHRPGSVELMDRTILELTRHNIEQQKNRFFVDGSPAAILIIELFAGSLSEIGSAALRMEEEMRAAGYGYHFPLITGPDIQKVWNLRKAGLGVLSNMEGDAKPVAVIEDTAVMVDDLPGYMDDFKQVLEKYGLNCVFFAHIGTGELHLRPVLNLKDPKDVEKFRNLAVDIARLVKKYRGSLSGEHGDGRLRGEFIPLILGEKNYELLKKVKQTWDPAHILNPGKITATPPMNTSLRYTPGKTAREIETVYDYSVVGGILRAIEKCNGSGDCRKTEKAGGTMCPSYMATRDENTTTRARANLLREFLTNSPKNNPFDHIELYDILDLCLACKGCKSECPSNVDMAKLKSEFLQHYHDEHGIPLRTRLIAYISTIQRLGSVFPTAFNFFATQAFFSRMLKKTLGFAGKRSIPVLYKITLKRWIRRNPGELLPRQAERGAVYLFIDEFSNFNDTETGISAIRLLTALGYRVMLAKNRESARTFISKGLLRKAKKKAIQNILTYKDLVSESLPLVGIEPSAILGFRDEYPDLAGKELREEASKMAKHALMIDEFIAGEYEKGKIVPGQFTGKPLHIKLHGHCQQKAVASTAPTKVMLGIPRNYSVEEIPSGCCGMAGSFGYEKEHYDLSMKVGELVLFPAIRNTPKEVVIAAPGTSCRHQIADGTGRKALHPVEIMYRAVKENNHL